METTVHVIDTEPLRRRRQRPATPTRDQTKQADLSKEPELDKNLMDVASR